MSDQENPTETATETPAETATETEGMSEEAFAAEWARLGLGDKPAADEPPPPPPPNAGGVDQKGVAKSDTSPGQPELESLQVEAEETPTSFDPVAYADAIDEIQRAGLKPSAFKGKSEGEVISFGIELNTRRRQRDREWTASQGHSKDDGQSGQDSSDAAQAKQPPAEAASALDPATLDATLTPFVEEFGEEAAPVAELLRTLATQNAALQSRLAQDEQARQLAPIEQAIQEELSGSDLSNPDARDKFLKYAEAKAELDGVEVEQGESPADFMRRVIRHAKGDEESTRKRATKVRTGKPATATPGNTPSTPKTREERLQDITDDFFRENFPEHL